MSSVEATGLTALNRVAQAIEKFKTIENLDYMELRVDLFEGIIRTWAVNAGKDYDKLIMSATEEDTQYLALRNEMYPALPKGTVQPEDRVILAKLISISLVLYVYGVVSDEIEEKDYDVAEVKYALQQKFIVPYMFSGLLSSVDEVIKALVIDQSTQGVDDFTVLASALDVLESIDEWEDIIESMGEEDENDMPDEEEEEDPYHDDVDSPEDEEPETETPVTEEPVAEEEEEEEEDPELVASVARVMSIYKDLFEVGFDLTKPWGILTSTGALIIRKGVTTVQKNASWATLFQVFNEASQNPLKQGAITEGVKAEDLRKVDMLSDINYYPEFQLGTALGILGSKRVESWTEMARLIRPELMRNIKHNLENGKDANAIIEALINCIVISEFDISSAVRLRANIGNSDLNKHKFESVFKARSRDFYQGSGKVYHNEMLNTGVMEVILVFDEVKFNGRPLFAYEAVRKQQERGIQPSLQDMIMGQDTSGRIMSVNLDRQDASIILIGAGQRSGKGVLTLNLLGTVLASGSPLIYMDGKPDMAKVLWDLGAKNGINPAVWDAAESHGNPIGRGAPEVVLRDNSGIFGVLMYLKVVQLMMLAASLQAKGETFGDGKRPFFIFDEALAVQQKMHSEWDAVLRLAKDKKADPADRDWAEAVVTWCTSMSSSLASVINSQLPMSGISTVWLFQRIQPTEWKKYSVKGMTSSDEINAMMKPIQSKSSIKLMGRGTADSEYGLSNVKDEKIIAERIMTDTGRHFAYTTSDKITSMSGVTVFKPYLVLNDAIKGSTVTENLRKNVGEHVWNVISENDQLDPAAGFEGFAQLLGDQAIQNLSKGREYLEAVMARVGLNYGSVDEYLYDASVESFLSLGTLVQGNTAAGDASGVYDPDTFSDQNATEPSASSPDNILGSFGQEDYGDMPEDGGDVDWSQVSSSPSSPSNIPDFLNPDHESDPNDAFGGAIPSAGAAPVSPTAPFSAPAAPVPTSPTAAPFVAPSSRQGTDNVYTPQIAVAQNPFEMFGTSESPVSCLNAIRETSKILLDEIVRMVGSLHRVETLEVSNAGLKINGIHFRPVFSQEVLQTMPFDIRNKVSGGNMIDLFTFSDIYKFKNLAVLSIDDPRLAEGRVRREMGIHPKRSWYILFSKIRSLRDLIISGEHITSESSAEQYDTGGRAGTTLTDRLRSTFGVSDKLVENNRMSRVFSSPPVKIMTNAAGWTLGVKGVMVAAAMFGPLGLLFGAFAGYGAYSHFKKGRNQPND